jgi:hypothetical protein
MKLTVVHNNSGINKKKYKMFDKFFKLLQKKFPLKDDLKIELFVFLIDFLFLAFYA